MEIQQSMAFDTTLTLFIYRRLQLTMNSRSQKHWLFAWES
jgi:hypothetical protein